MLVIRLMITNPPPAITNPISTIRRDPSLSIRYPLMGPMIEPSTRLREKAMESWVRDQANSRSSTTNQAVMPWNSGTVPMTMTKAATPTSVQP